MAGIMARRSTRLAFAGAALAALSVGSSYAQTTPLTVMKDLQRPSAPGMMPHKPMAQHISLEPGYPMPSVHTGQAHDPFENYTAKWTRADARQIKAMSNPNVAIGANSLPAVITMPAIPVDFPTISNKVWVWDTWPLANAEGNQFSYNGWDVIFCLTARQDQGYGFDDRHVHARIGYFYRRSSTPSQPRPPAGGWIFGGYVFPEGASASIYKGQRYTQQAEWSGSARILRAGSNEVNVFYTDLAFNRSAQGGNITPPQATIAKSLGRIHADFQHVWFTGFTKHDALLTPDGKYYQTGQQNQFFSFRDPYPFQDPAHPGQTFMVFEGNSAGMRGQTPCDASDLGYRPNEPHAETVAQVNASGALFQRANIGLAVATKPDLTAWRFLPPLLSGNCVNDQTERPQMYIVGDRYYLMTISHRTTFAAGIDGPDGEYGFYGHGIRSDWKPLNNSSGLMLANPTDLNTAPGTDFDPNPQQNPNAFQSYSHYYMPDGLVTSFIDTVRTRRGGTEAPTVQIFLYGPNARINPYYADSGLGKYGDITPNLKNINVFGFMQDIRSGAPVQAPLPSSGSGSGSGNGGGSGSSGSGGTGYGSGYDGLTAGLVTGSAASTRQATEQAAQTFLGNTSSY